MGGFANIRVLQLITLTAAILGLLLAVWAITPSRADAHGKELQATMSTLLLNQENPLTRLYRVTVVYASDLEPVENATVTLSATRVEGGPGVSGIELTAISGGAGVYVGEIDYQRFGSWQVTVQVRGPLGQGEAESGFIDQVRPRAITASEQESLLFEAERVRRLQLFFKFGWWPDMVNIILRVVHSSAAIAYFAMTGLVLFIALAGIPTGWPDLPAKLHQRFIPVTVGSLIILSASGMYSADFDSPTNAPGIYDIGAILRLPYGEAYLGAFLVKPLAWLILIYLAVRTGQELKLYARLPLVGGEATAMALPAVRVTPRLKHLALANLGVGIVLVVDIALIIYLHYLSHLGVFIPQA
jgi:hypothetical protein